MFSSRAIFFFIFSTTVLMLMITQALAQFQVCLNDRGNYTANSTYQRNLNTVLTSLSATKNSTGYGFYYSSYGENPDRVEAILLCRGDVNADDCLKCLNDSRVSLTEFCPNQKEAFRWTDPCTLRYSNRSIYGKVETTPSHTLYNTQDVSPSLETEFIQKRDELLGSLKDEAASAGPLRKLAFGNVTIGSALTKVYGMTACTPDLTEKECRDCLESAFGQYAECCYLKTGGININPSCYIRNEIVPILDTASVVPLPSPPITSPPQPSIQTGSKGNKSRTVIIIIVSVGASLVTLFLFICVCVSLKKTKKKLKRKLRSIPSEDADEIPSPGALQLDFDTIQNATDNFSEANKLGEGGFGSVYKGQLTDGELVAVKRLSMNSRQGDIEFKNEVILMAKLQHRNLVRLQGFCLEGNERILVYEYVPNTSLDHIIFDPTKRAQLDWNCRYKIIVGIVRGLMYLHEDSRLRIIHRDLKVSNILLDDELNPKIADFGMARLFVHDQTQGNTSRIVGTYGYMAPEYAMHSKFSVKSDVYSFGVLVLEIVSGQKNSSFCLGEEIEDLLTYAWTCWKEGCAPNLIDPTLRIGSRSEIMRCIHIGLLCVQENVVDRPTMASISVMLNSYSLALTSPSPPNSFMTRRTDSSQPNSNNNLIDGTVVNEDWTELCPR